MNPQERQDRQVSEELQWLRDAQDGQLSWSNLAERILAREHSADALHRPDLDRERRCGFGEVIFGEGKTADGISQIASQLLDHGQREVLVTRVAPSLVADVTRRFLHSTYDSAGRTLRLSNTAIAPPCPALQKENQVCVVTAGSTDLHVAREATETLAWMRVPNSLITDVGVAGPYRLLSQLDRLRRAKVVVVVAGMEGAAQPIKLGQ